MEAVVRSLRRVRNWGTAEAARCLRRSGGSGTEAVVRSLRRVRNWGTAGVVRCLRRWWRSGARETTQPPPRIVDCLPNEC